MAVIADKLLAIGADPVLVAREVRKLEVRLQAYHAAARLAEARAAAAALWPEPAAGIVAVALAAALTIAEPCRCRARQARRRQTNRLVKHIRRPIDRSTALAGIS
ncbi:hypothetical protein [Bradyrhizobium sp. WSM3983]|uniref:hypothetical protein n=1 Tax=Bradyrhizobium sp. WSM3983 TaxID=1038867 RepID=UPI00041EB2BF|nr:hypothetical protein [Bradyrhizobium sp. WSM3983]